MRRESLSVTSIFNYKKIIRTARNIIRTCMLHVAWECRAREFRVVRASEVASLWLAPYVAQLRSSIRLT